MADERLKQKPDDNIVPIAVGNPAKAASLAIDQSHLDEYFGEGGDGEQRYPMREAA